jgi:hypothetical protein
MPHHQSPPTCLDFNILRIGVNLLTGACEQRPQAPVGGFERAELRS